MAKHTNNQKLLPPTAPPDVDPSVDNLPLLYDSYFPSSSQQPYFRLPAVGKDFRARPKTKDSPKKLQAACPYLLQATLPQLLAARGLPAKESVITSFLFPTQEDLPTAHKLKNCDLVVERLLQGIRQQERAMVICDFDVDGITSGCQFKLTCDAVGLTTEVLMPHRIAEGYGPNQRLIQTAIDRGCKLLVTLDCGSTNHELFAEATALGISVIVIDHHQLTPNDPPPTKYFINPSQTGCGFQGNILAATGLTWFLCRELLEASKTTQQLSPTELLDLAALGTICDMVPLVGVNRIIAKCGLNQLSHRKRIGLAELMKQLQIPSRGSGLPACEEDDARYELSSEVVAFRIGPCLNAASRMGGAEPALELLTTNDRTRAAQAASELIQRNNDRKQAERNMTLKAEQILNQQGWPQRAAVVWDPAFSAGLVGLVAQRLSERLNCPAIVLGQSDHNGIYRGSVRAGPDGFNVYEALNDVSQLLEGFGGHAKAGGLQVQEKNLGLLRKKFSVAVEKQLGDRPKATQVHWDLKVPLRQVNADLVEQLQRLEPTGQGNPTPLLLIEKLEVKRVSVIQNWHLEVILTDGKRDLPAYYWNRDTHPDLIEGQRVSVVGSISYSPYRRGQRLVLSLEAVRGC